MELVKIEKLIEKYDKAETTLEEEKILKDYFLNENIPNYLESYKSMFTYFNDSSLEHSNKSISLSKPKENNYLRWLSVAAMIVFFMGIFSVYQKNLREKEEARMAYMETQKALNMISQTLNKGNNAIAQLQVFENTQNRIFKTNK
jgi:hypothetical protein